MAIIKSVNRMRVQKSFIRSPSGTQSEAVKVAKAWDTTMTRLRMMLLLL